MRHYRLAASAASGTEKLVRTRWLILPAGERTIRKIFRKILSALCIRKLRLCKRWSAWPAEVPYLQAFVALWQEAALASELPWQVIVNNVIKTPFGERLLLSAHAHFEHLLDGGDPLGIGHNEWIVL